MENINVPISPGELLDKITILEIKSENIEELYNGLLEQEQVVNDLIGIISNKVVAGGYGKKARNEMIAAEILRGLSVILMIAIAYIVGDTFWETTKETFELTKVLSRIAIAIFVSVPAAYLAKESANIRLIADKPVAKLRLLRNVIRHNQNS